MSCRKVEAEAERIAERGLAIGLVRALVLGGIVPASRLRREVEDCIRRSTEAVLEDSPGLSEGMRLDLRGAVEERRRRVSRTIEEAECDRD